MKLGIATGALLASGEFLGSSALAGTVKLEHGGKDFSPATGVERKAIPTACWSCVTRCAAIGFVEDGRIVKVESNPNSIRTGGKMCAKGQAGPNQVYFPDRVLYPMRRVGKRGGHRWKRITWDEALTELASRLKKLRDAGHPEKLFYHYGRQKASSSKIIKSVFLKEAWGATTYGNHTSICEGGKWTAQELTWGKHYDNWDFDNTKFVLNFGSNVFETHTNHIPTSHRLIKAMVERGVKMVTFDVRLSNTAAKSTEWVPVKPGTDGAVVLAMCNVIMQNDLYDRGFFKFIRATENVNASVDEKIATLKSHLAKYTPEWAEKISGVSASKIKSLAIEFAKTKPAVVISYRGAIAHYNGNDTERAIQMLAAITGNIDNPGGRCRAVGAKWKYPHSETKAKVKKGLKIHKGFKGSAAYPTHGQSHQVLKMIKDGKAGRPEVYMWYCYNPVYVNGECRENMEILKDEKLIPFTVTSNIIYDESSSLADMILPDATYLERWDWEDMVSPVQVPEYYIRQPLIKPLGEARDFKDVLCELAERMDMPLGFKSAEEFVRKSCELTAKKVKGFPGFEYLKTHGVWYDPNAKPKYYGYKKEVKEKDLKKDGVIFDEATGVYWNWKKSKAKSEEEAKKKGYTHTKKAYKGYVGQKIGDKVYKGFKPDKLNKTGYFEIYSALLKEKGFSPLPVYMPIPEHEKMRPNELILTTYKVAVQIHSRSTHCKWLTELYHDNPAWINSKTASVLGIRDGDKIKVKSKIGEIETTAKVTEKVVPGVIAISYHLGRWETGRYASGKKSPVEGGAHDNDPDLQLKWWSTYGMHPNWIIPNAADPINGQMRWMDTVVTVTKA
jgi:anaerobic selenocysteine-containing dehydrogenase